MEGKVICGYILVQFLGYLLQTLPFLFLFYAPFRQESLRFSKKKLLLILFEAYIAAAAGAAVYLGLLYSRGAGEAAIMTHANLIFSAFLVLGSLVYFFSFREGVRGQLLLYMVVIQYGVLVYVINKIAAKFFDEPYIYDVFPYSPGSLITYAVVTGITIPFICHFLRSRNVQELVQINQKELKLVTGCSAAILVLMGISLQMEANLTMQGVTSSGRIYLSIWMLCLMAGDVLTYFIYFGCLILGKEKQEMQSRLVSYQHQYKWMNERSEKEKKNRHNLRHHLRTMDLLAREGQTEKLQEYIGNYLSEIKEIELQKISGNPVLNEVMSYYVVQAQEKKVNLTYHIEIKENLILNLADMTVLLGNALENALNACERYREGTPDIQVMIRQLKKSLLIKIENSIPSGEYRAKGPEAKKGYGMDSIDLIARKYQGAMEARREKDRFILRVILYISEEEEM
ncbi:MAG: sensor histidine kinase [Ruminococcus sp.]